MTDEQLILLVERLEEASALFNQQEAPLTAPEISVKSMLYALRLQVIGELRRKREPVEE